MVRAIRSMPHVHQIARQPSGTTVPTCAGRIRMSCGGAAVRAKMPLPFLSRTAESKARSCQELLVFQPLEILVETLVIVDT